MKKLMIMAAAILLSLPFASAQDDSAAVRKAQNVKIKPYGFIRNYFNYDSRRMLTVCGGEYLMIPYDEDWNMSEADANLLNAENQRYDRNAVPEAHLLALSSRFGVSLEGGQLTLGNQQWDLAGKLEGDFAGFGTQSFNGIGGTGYTENLTDGISGF